MHKKEAALASRVRDAIEIAFGDISRWSPEELRSNKHFTRTLFAALAKLGKELKYDVRMSSTSPHENWEYLFDVCFLETGRTGSPGDGYFTRDYPLRKLVLALESEWGTNVNEILYDFCKLLLVRAELKVLVFYQPNEEKIEEVISRIRNAINEYQDKQPGDAYLVCALTGDQVKPTYL